MPKKSYVMLDTNGEEVAYSYKDMIEICRQYLKKYTGNILPTKQDCEDEIPDFIKRYKLIVKNNVEENNKE